MPRPQNPLSAPALVIIFGLIAVVLIAVACSRRPNLPGEDVYKPPNPWATGLSALTGATGATGATSPVAPSPLGKEAAKESLANAAVWVGRVGYVTAFLSIAGFVVGSFFGGIGRKTALTGLAVAAGCFFARYFILAYGFVVSETLSWVLIAALACGVATVATLGVRYLWGLVKAQHIAGLGSASIPSAIKFLPVPAAVKEQLRGAHDYMADPAPGEPLIESLASNLLAKYRLPVATPAPIT